jgi:hypothetical protein
MLHRLAAHLDQLRHTLVQRWRRRREDAGVMVSLETVVLALGVLAIAALVVVVLREAVSGRLDQLK